jgi:hypothetical protein
MPYFGIPIRNGLPIGLGSVAGFGIAPFEPYSLFENGEQGAWYDPSDFSTLFTDSAGTTPVTGVEQFVGRMNDKSGRGNHATSTGTKRPKLAARYNLLTYSEQFDNAAWVKTDASVSANTGIAPDGTTTADTLTTTVTSNPNVQQVPGPNYQNISVTLTFWAQAITSTEAVGQLFVNGGSPGLINATSGGIISGPGTADTSSFSTGTIRVTGLSTTQWTRIFITGTPTSAVGSLAAYIKNRTGGAAVIGDSIRIWGADLRPASQATGLIGPTYQRVVDAATYDTAGFLPYLQFDGVDDSMSTGSIDFTATDKMTVWAGVRKLSDATRGMVAELQDAAGSFQLNAPVATSPSYRWASRGSIGPVTVDVTGYAAPISNVLTGIADIANDTTTLRINGAQVGTNSGDQGTGNYGNYPLYIGQRGGSTLPFNGWLSSLIIRGAQSTDSQISATESWVNGRTGAY